MEGSRLRRAPRPREKAGFTRSNAEARSNLHSRKVVYTFIIHERTGIVQYWGGISSASSQSVPNSIRPQCEEPAAITVTTVLRWVDYGLCSVC